MLQISPHLEDAGQLLLAQAVREGNSVPGHAAEVT